VLIGAGFPLSLKAHSGYQSPEPAHLASFGRGEPVPRICSDGCAHENNGSIIG
jgi:hypothetical protein